MPSHDPRIDACIERAAPFAWPILHHVRALVHEACPDVEETVRWDMPAFAHAGRLLGGMAAFKRHASFGFRQRRRRRCRRRARRHGQFRQARLGRGSAAAPNAARADLQGRPAQRSRREGRADAAHARRCSQRPALRTRCRRHGRHSRRSARASGTSTSNGCSRPRARRRADAASPRPSRRSARESAPLETPRRLNATKVRSAASFSQRSGAIGQNGSSFVSQ